MLRNLNLTQKRLKELLTYDKNTGVFVWINKTSRNSHVKPGAIAGWEGSTGYVYICIEDKSYTISRLAFLYVEGCFPENDMDHVNRIRNDNRWCNLREVTPTCNARNKGLQKNNNSGVSGVTFDKKRNKWLAYISLRSKLRHLGIFKSTEKNEAILTRLSAEQCLNWMSCDNNSSAYRYAVENGLVKKINTYCRNGRYGDPEQD